MCLIHCVADIYHGLFDVLLVIVAARSIVIAVNYLNSDVALGKTSTSFTCEHSTEERFYLTFPDNLVLYKKNNAGLKGKIK